jgi:amino-acid N-acetyltransferase
MSYTIRPARTRDVPMIRKLIDSNVESGRLLSKATVTLYEDVQEFCVAELVDDGTLAGCGALHVMWEDLAEVRTVAVVPTCQGLGIGHAIVRELLARARVLGVNRVFCLTFAVDFFVRHGFQPINGTPVAAEVYSELLRSYDEGVAEFLDLERVKPNTLGNTRMLLRLLPGLRNEHRCGSVERARRYEPSGSIVRSGSQRGACHVAGPGGADSAAGSLRRVHRRPGYLLAPGDGTQARRQARWPTPAP